MLNLQKGDNYRHLLTEHRDIGTKNYWKYRMIKCATQLLECMHAHTVMLSWGLKESSSRANMPVVSHANRKKVKKNNNNNTYK